VRRIAQREALRPSHDGRTERLDDDRLLDDFDWFAGRHEAIDVRRAALRALADEERPVFWLHYWCDHSCREIAGRLGLPVGTVKIRLFRGRARVRAALEATDRR